MFEMIDMKKLCVSPECVKLTDYDLEVVEVLAEDIKTNGLCDVFFINVRPFGDGFEVLFPSMLYFGALSAGLAEARCSVLHDVDDVAARAMVHLADEQGYMMPLRDPTKYFALLNKYGALDDQVGLVFTKDSGDKK